MKNILLIVIALAFSTISVAQTGGPDAFGYSYITSNEASGPTYAWIELDTALGGSGTWSTTSTVNDGYEGNIPLSFDFPFYGKLYDSISISSNGALFFANFNFQWSNVCMPGDPAYPFPEDTAFIAVLWGDLVPSSSGNIFYQDFGTHFVVEYSEIIETTSADADTWEVIIFPNGDIVMQYKDASFLAVPVAYTTGIQGSPTVGLQYDCFSGGNQINDSLAILWTGPPIGIAERSAIDFSIYPNPNNGDFNIVASSNSASQKTSVEITNMHGQLVYAKQFNNGLVNENISLTNLASGMYFVKVWSGEGSGSKRVVVR